VHAAAHFLHPPSVFVAHHIGQADVCFFLPDAFDDVQVGAADTGTADADDDISIVLQFRLGDVLPSDKVGLGKTGVVPVKNCSFHDSKPSVS
jgi:hypothetical protein